MIGECEVVNLVRFSDDLARHEAIVPLQAFLGAVLAQPDAGRLCPGSAAGLVQRILGNPGSFGHRADLPKSGHLTTL
jgi:hypothetical protein